MRRFYGDPNEVAIDLCDEVGPDLPYVIYGRLRVQDGCTLTIEPGTDIYATVVQDLGGWRHLGCGWQLEAPILSRRPLDDAYADAVGQWGINVDLDLANRGESGQLFSIQRWHLDVVRE